MEVGILWMHWLQRYLSFFWKYYTRKFLEKWVILETEVRYQKSKPENWLFGHKLILLISLFEFMCYLPRWRNNTHIKIDSLSSTEAGTLNGKPYILCRRYFFNKLQFFDSFTDVYTKPAPSEVFFSQGRIYKYRYTGVAMRMVPPPLPLMLVNHVQGLKLFW